MFSIIKNYFTRKTLIYLLILLLLICMRSFLCIYPVILIQQIVDLASSNQFTLDKLLSLGCIYLIMQIFGAATTSYKMYIETALQADLSFRSQIHLYKILTEIRVDCIKKLNHADVSSTLIQDCEYIGNNIISFCSDFLSAILMFVSGFYYMAEINLSLTLIVLPLGITSSLVIQNIRKKTAKNLGIQRERAAMLLNTFTEGILGFAPLYVHKCTDAYFMKFEKDGEAVMNIQKEQGKLESIANFITSASFMSTIGLMLVFSAYFVKMGYVSTGGLTAILMYNHMLTDPLISLQNTLRQTSQIKVSTERLKNIYELPKHVPMECMCVDRIIVNDVSFQYDDSPVLENISLDICQPLSVGIYGKTGVGKTTLVNLLAGMLSPTNGCIHYYFQGRKIDGCPIVSYMLQDEYLFDASIRENIRISNPTITEQEMNEILDICNLREVIRLHGEGSVGANGKLLSGGERKRILIARTLAHPNADIYFFDEMSTSLDSRTFFEIFEKVEKRLKGKIRIYIEHNKDNMQYFDKIIEMPVKT